MSLFKVTVKITGSVNGVRLEKGMSVEVVVGTSSTQCSSVFGTTEGKEKLAQAFMTKYGVDVRKACAMNSSRMEVEKLN